MKPTSGVHISPWEMEISKSDGEKDTVHFNVFDFSGKESLYSAHEYFFSGLELRLRFSLSKTIHYF